MRNDVKTRSGKIRHEICSGYCRRRWRNSWFDAPRYLSFIFLFCINISPFLYLILSREMRFMSDTGDWFWESEKAIYKWILKNKLAKIYEAADAHAWFFLTMSKNYDGKDSRRQQESSCSTEMPIYAKVNGFLISGSQFCQGEYYFQEEYFCFKYILWKSVSFDWKQFIQKDFSLKFLSERNILLEIEGNTIFL